MTRPTVADVARLQRALIRLLWDSVADQFGCDCYPNDRCPQCEAMLALGLGHLSGRLALSGWSLRLFGASALSSEWTELDIETGGMTAAEVTEVAMSGLLRFEVPES